MRCEIICGGSSECCWYGSEGGNEAGRTCGVRVMILLVRIVGLMFVLRLVVLQILRVILQLLMIRIGCESRVGIVAIVVMSSSACRW